jgi:hypothetical protein
MYWDFDRHYVWNFGCVLCFLGHLWSVTTGQLPLYENVVARAFLAWESLLCVNSNRVSLRKSIALRIIQINKQKLLAFPDLENLHTGLFLSG